MMPTPQRSLLSPWLSIAAIASAIAFVLGATCLALGHTTPGAVGLSIGVAGFLMFGLLVRLRRPGAQQALDARATGFYATTRSNALLRHLNDLDLRQRSRRR
jgi:hypothetical protein